MNFKLKNIDATKAEPSLKHEYVIEKDWNLDENPVSVTAKYLRAGETVQFIRTREDGSSTIDARELFKKKVVEIHNMTIEDEKGNKRNIQRPEDFLELPDDGSGYMTDIIMDVMAHLLNSNKLSEDEVKN